MPMLALVWYSYFTVWRFSELVDAPISEWLRWVGHARDHRLCSLSIGYLRIVAHSIAQVGIFRAESD